MARVWSAIHAWLGGIGVLFGLLFFAGSTLWALASPLGSVPDEPSHMVRAAAAAFGNLDSMPSVVEAGVDDVSVPAYVDSVFARTCFAFEPQTPADCPTAGLDMSNGMVPSVTSAGLNSPVFYLLVGWPVLVADGDQALYGMRLASAALCAIAWGWSLALLSRAVSSPMLAPAAFLAATPMLQYLAGSVNPNGAEAVGAVACFAGLMGVIRLGRHGLVQSVALVVFGSILVSSARTVALLWIPVAIAAAVGLSEMSSVRACLRRSSTWWTAAIAAIPVLGAVGWFVLQSGQHGASSASVPMSAFDAMREVLIHTPAYAKGYIGIFGWLDTSPPSAMYAVYMVVVAALGVAALVWSTRARRFTVAGLALTIVVLPVVLQGALAPSIGFVWQGRYILAVVVIAALAAGLAFETTSPKAPWRGTMPAVIVGGGALVLVQCGMFLWALRRYVTGEGVPLSQLVTNPEWQPPGGWILLTVGEMLVVTMTCVVAVTMARRGWARASSASSGLE